MSYEPILFFELKACQTKDKSILFRASTVSLALLFLIVPLSKLDENIFSVNAGVYICNLRSCLDHTPTHLTYFCDKYH